MKWYKCWLHRQSNGISRYCLSRESFWQHEWTKGEMAHLPIIAVRTLKISWVWFYYHLSGFIYIDMGYSALVLSPVHKQFNVHVVLGDYVGYESLKWTRFGMFELLFTLSISLNWISFIHMFEWPNGISSATNILQDYFCNTSKGSTTFLSSSN